MSGNDRYEARTRDRANRSNFLRARPRPARRIAVLLDRLCLPARVLLHLTLIPPSRIALEFMSTIKGSIVIAGW